MAKCHNAKHVAKLRIQGVFMKVPQSRSKACNNHEVVHLYDYMNSLIVGWTMAYLKYLSKETNSVLIVC